MLGTEGPTANLAWNYGAGIKVFATKRFAARIDIRRHQSSLHDTLTQVVFTGRVSDRCEDFDIERFVCVDTPYVDELRFTELTLGFTIAFPRR
jgi:hypothetical protein